MGRKKKETTVTPTPKRSRQLTVMIDNELYIRLKTHALKVEKSLKDIVSEVFTTYFDENNY